MTKRIMVPFGPQHPVLPEPIHLDLVLEDETVVDVIPSIGYIHRGFESLWKSGNLLSMCMLLNAPAGSAALSTGQHTARALSRS